MSITSLPHPTAVPSPSGAAPHRPLVITADPDLLDDVLRLAAAAGVEVEVAAHAASAVGPWHRATLVLVGDDLAESVAATEPRRRDGVVLVRAGHPGDEPDGSMWRRAVAIGAEIAVVLPEGEPWLVARLADAAEGPSHPGGLLAITGGRGGVGASTLAAAVALRAERRGLRAALIDLDPWGGGLDIPLGLDQTPGLRWPDLSHTVGRLSPSALVDALPRRDGLSVLSWDRGPLVDLPQAAVASVLDAAMRGFDLVVIDAPRSAGDPGREALRRAMATLLVVPCEFRAVAAAHRVLMSIGAGGASVGLITTGPSPSGLDPTWVASSLGLDLVGALRHDGRVAAAIERGEPLPERGSLSRVADAVLDSAVPGQPVP